MSELNSEDSDICQNLSHLLENNIVTKQIIHTIFNNDTLEWLLLTHDYGSVITILVYHC